MSAIAIQPPAVTRREALAQDRENAREMYRQSLDARRPLTGPQMSEMTGRSSRWCTTQINAVHAERSFVPYVPPAPPAPSESERVPSESERPATVSPWLARAAVLLVLLVFSVSAATSYVHQRTFAERAGEHLSGLLPLTVDALVFSALLTMHVFRKLDVPTPGTVTGCLWIGIAASIAANVAAAPPIPEAWATAVWPPLVAFLTHAMVTKLLDALSAARKETS